MALWLYYLWEAAVDDALLSLSDLYWEQEYNHVVARLRA